MNDVTRTSKDVTTCKHEAEFRMLDTLPCPWCVIDELKRGREELQRCLNHYQARFSLITNAWRSGDNSAVLDAVRKHITAKDCEDADRLVRASHEPETAPCPACAEACEMLGRAGIADGDLIDKIGDAIEAMERASQPPRDGYFTFAQISYALNRSLYAKTGNLAIEGIIEDLWKTLTNSEDSPPSSELAILRNLLGNLYMAVRRRPEYCGDADLKFAMKEVAQGLGEPYSTATKEVKP